MPKPGILADVSVFGHLDYMLEAFYEIAAPVCIQHDVDIHSAATPLRFAELFGPLLLRGDNQITVKTFLDSSPEFPFNRMFTFKAEDFANVVAAPAPCLLRRVPLGRRFNVKLVVANEPPRASLNRWRREAADVRDQQAEDMEVVDQETPEEKILYHVPQKRARTSAYGQRPCQGKPAALQREYDPIKSIRAVDFSRFLRCTADFSEALEAAATYNLDPDTDPAPRDSSDDPCRSGLMNARAKMDIVGLNLDRRQFHAEMRADSVRSINVFTDGSPVTGSELQGMLVEVVKKDKSTRRVILAGSSLAYGRCDAINKTVAFLWAVWLSFGPLLAHML